LLIDEKTQLADSDTAANQNSVNLSAEIRKLSNQDRELKRKLIFNEGNLQNLLSVKKDILKNAKLAGTVIEFCGGDSQMLPENADDAEVNYSLIQEYTEKIKKPQSIPKHIEKFETSLKSLEEKLIEIPPLNQNFINKHKEVEAEFKKITEKYTESSKELSATKAEFDKVRGERTRTFMAYFNHVTEKVEEIYRDIMDNPEVQVYLQTENAHEPYAGGVTYSCVAPGKKYTYLENLSGGEKTMAALALIFALSAASKSISSDNKEDAHKSKMNDLTDPTLELPSLFILDEIDSALDSQNLTKLVNFILRRKVHNNTQFLLISHKLDVFSRSDHLFGLTRDCVGDTQVLSIDLTKYD